MPKRTEDKPVAKQGTQRSLEQSMEQAAASDVAPAKTQQQTPRQQGRQPLAQLQPQQEPPAAKKVKREYDEAPTPSRAVGQPVPGEQQQQQPGTSKRRQREAAAAAAPVTAAADPPAVAGTTVAAPTASGDTPRAKQQRIARRKAGNPAGQALARVVSTMRQSLEAIQDVEGVKEALDKFPECVIVGGIAARRELLGSLLGDSGYAVQAAAGMVPAGMRQPLALEFRWEDAIDLDRMSPQEASRYVQSIGEHASKSVGSRMKSEALRVRLFFAGAANLDVVQLPEPAGGGGAPNPKIEEIRQKYLGSQANLIACCEPGLSLELCKKYDPAGRRTVLIGAASAPPIGADGMPIGGGQQSAVSLCGEAAARMLEERFQALCKERALQWMTDLDRMESRLRKSSTQARDAETNERAEEVLSRTRVAGMSFAHAFQQVRGERTSGFRGQGQLLNCTTGAATLEEELNDFATAAKTGLCGIGPGLSPEDAAKAANDLFSHFGGVSGYTEYLRKEVKMHGADEHLNGEAAWQRLVVEIEIAMRLSHPPAEKLAGLALAAVRCGGTGVHGHQRWEDVSSKLMMSIAFEPLRTRVHYIAARVAHALTRQKALVTAWMATSAEGPTNMFQGSIFAKHIALMRSSPISRERIFNAYDEAAKDLATQVLKYLNSTLMAGCISPAIMLRPNTNPDMDPSKMKKSEESEDARTPAARTLEAKQRVKVEMAKRESKGAGGLPKSLRDIAFEPATSIQSLPHVEVMLRKAYRVLAQVVSNQAVAFVDAAMSGFTQNGLEMAMTSLDFTPEQWRALREKHGEMANMRKQVDDRLDALYKCTSSLRQAHQAASSLVMH